jgi:hypothetical protein
MREQGAPDGMGAFIHATVAKLLDQPSDPSEEAHRG